MNPSARAAFDTVRPKQGTGLPNSPIRILPILLPVLLGGCALEDSRTADRAPRVLRGLSERALESCLGAPDQHASFGATDILTYYATSSSSTSYSVPIVGGLGFSNGGYCHATFTIENGAVARLLYSGEKNATLAPNAYCAPILRTCLAWLDAHPEDRPVAAVPPVAASGARQPQASTAGVQADMPTPMPTPR